MGGVTSGNSSMETIFNTFIAEIENGRVKLPDNIREMFFPARQVKIIPEGMYVENGRVILLLSFENSNINLPLKVTLNMGEVVS